ncbi:Tautomerase enzyme [Aquabacterium sp. A7-Y]|uniref:tautomerase family protein n=1 Tax=Aquabacterium sp. A7-Y TaxID=1349605 RepID=UPI00223D7E03|nr:Tautomerase enzyme [Aquabacterium sp. A7-Y]MCW7536948.1 Tautomerase enzyme [Aquabacterium sp. A7-Y]
MPMIDVYIPNGALTPQSEATLMRELTDILIRHEGMDPSNPQIRDVTWIFVHRPAQIYRSGAPAPAPIYRITPTVPEGQYTDEARAGLVRDVTAAVARAEGSSVAEVGARVWVFPTEVFDGGWGSRGVIRRLPDILELFGGPESRAIGIERLARKRRSDAISLLKEALSEVRP